MASALEVGPVQLELVALHLGQRLTVDQLSLHLEVGIDFDDQYLAEVALEVERNRISSFEGRDRLHLNEVVAQFPV